MNSNINYSGVLILEILNNITGILKVLKLENILVLGGQYAILNSLCKDLKQELSHAIFGSGSSARLITNTIGTFTDSYQATISSWFPPATPTSSMSLMTSWKLTTQEYNGNTISEIGLVVTDKVTTNQNLFCRITLSEADQVYKTSNISINGAWYMTVTEST